MTGGGLADEAAAPRGTTGALKRLLAQSGRQDGKGNGVGKSDHLIGARCTNVLPPKIEGYHRSEDGPKLVRDAIAPNHEDEN